MIIGMHFVRFVCKNNFLPISFNKYIYKNLNFQLYALVSNAEISYNINFEIDT